MLRPGAPVGVPVLSPPSTREPREPGPQRVGPRGHVSGRRALAEVDTARGSRIPFCVAWWEGGAWSHQLWVHSFPPLSRTPGEQRKARDLPSVLVTWAWGQQPHAFAGGPGGRRVPAGCPLVARGLGAQALPIYTESLPGKCRVTHTAPRWGRGDGPQREGLIQSRRARVPRGGTAWGAVPAPRSSPGFLWIAVARTSATLHCGRGSGESAQPVRSGPLPRQAAERPSRTERGRRWGRGAACGGDVRFAHSHLLCQLTRCPARGFRPRPGT